MVVALHEVFGIGREIPKYTYVDRSGLDTKFGYLLKTERHIVVHGGSKQGKSCLRKKNLTENNCVIIQCLPSMDNTKEIWSTALRLMGARLPEQKSSSMTKSSSGEIVAAGGLNIGVITVGGSGSDSKTIESKEEISETSPSGYVQDLKFLAKNLHEQKKRLILEDFHYLSEEVRKQVAFSLKALYELGVYVIIIGIWSEQNLLTYYNGDLTGRVEEINIVWYPPELEEVLVKGEASLNIKFSSEIKKEMINSSFENVGLLQRLAEKICQLSGIYESQDELKEIINMKFILEARENLIRDIGQRYLRIGDVFDGGFRTKTQLKVYYYIFKALTEYLSNANLLKGIPRQLLLETVQSMSENIRQSDLTSALEKIERLQSRKEITPL